MKKTLLFVALLASVSVKAQTTFTVDGYQYKVTGPQSVELVKGNSTDTLVSVPASVSYGGSDYAVKSIGEESFLWTSAKTIIIPSSVDSIKSKAFYYGKPTKVVLSEGLKYIGYSAFGGVNCTELEIPSTVTKIESYAFFSSQQLQKLTLHEGLKSIGNAAFYHPKSLLSLEIPASVDSIGNTAFATASSLTSLKLNEGLKFVGDGAFSGASLLASVTLPSTLTTLGDEVFLKCAKLTEVSLPASLTAMGTSVFAKTAITSYKVAEGSGHFKVKDGCLYSADETVLYAVPMSGLTSLRVSSKCIGINGGAAWGASLTSVTLPSNLFAIDGYAFEDAPLASVTIPASVTFIGEQAFANTDLKSVVVPENVGYLGDGAFAGCDSLKEATLPSSVTAMENHLFFRCAKLTKLTCLSNSAPEILEGYNEDYDVAFYGIASNAKLYVPLGAAQSFRDKGWDNYFTIEELTMKLFSPTSTDPVVGSTLGKGTPLSFKLTFDRNLTVAKTEPDVTVRKGSPLYANLFTPDDTWKVNLSSDKRSITLWASDYDGYTMAYDFDTSSLYYVIIPSGTLKDADGNINDRIVLSFNTTATGISQVKEEDSFEGAPVERFNLSGQKLDAPQRGINIVRYANGKSRKVIVR